jgi:hypothetical protein
MVLAGKIGMGESAGADSYSANRTGLGGLGSDSPKTDRTTGPDQAGDSLADIGPPTPDRLLIVHQIMKGDLNAGEVGKGMLRHREPPGICPKLRNEKGL